ncbi:MAG: choice-of-anchor J domain-containing protein [Candidatus Zixiibacteriota bacterium]
MKEKLFILLMFFFIIASIFGIERQVTYQGKITDIDGIGISGLYDMNFALFDDATDGTMLDEVALTDIQVSKGLFSVDLPFDLEMADLEGDLYLQIAIDGDVMRPREMITTEVFSFYSIYSDTASYAIGVAGADSAIYSDSTGAVAWDDITGRPISFDAFQRLRGEAGIWLEDSATIVAGEGVSVAQIGDSIRISAAGSSNNIYNQDTLPQENADFWVDGSGTYGGTTTYADAMITTGPGTSQISTRPLNGGTDRYARNKSMIWAEELDVDGAATIDEIQIYMSGDGIGSVTEDPWDYNNVSIYMELVTDDALDTDFDVSTATEVYTSSALSIPVSEGWKTIDIDDFSYDGTSNIIIYFENMAMSPYSSADAPQWRYTTLPDNYRCAASESDDYMPSTLLLTYNRPDYRISFVDLPTVVDQVSIYDGYLDADNDITSDGDISGNSFTLNGETITDWQQAVQFDTISSDLTDTIVIHDAAKITGELIVDSIQAAGDTIHLDDNMHARCALFQEPQDRDILLSESFEEMVPPVSWTEDSANALDSTWHHSNASRHWGTYSAGIITAEDAQDEWLISDATYIPPATTYYLTFYSDVFWGSAPSNNDDYYVKITSDGGSSWEIEANFSDSSSAGRHSWDMMYVIDLTDYEGSNIQVAFHAAGTEGIKHNWYIDDVSIFANIGTVNPKVEICDGNITVDGNLDANGIILDGILRESWPSGGSGDADTLTAERHDVVVVDEDFEVIGKTYIDTLLSHGDTLYFEDNVKLNGDLIIDGELYADIKIDTLKSDNVDTIVVNHDFKVVGELIADSIQAAGDFLYIDDKLIANYGIETDSLRLGGVTLDSWPDEFSNTLDDAYNNYGGSGQIVEVDEGRIIFRNEVTTGNAIKVVNNDIELSALNVENLNTSGPAIYCNGDLNIEREKKIYSITGDITMQIDAPTSPGGGGLVGNQKFRVIDTDESELFYVDEDGHTESKVFIADSIELAGVKRGSWPDGSGSDDDWTISGNHIYNVNDSAALGAITPTAKLHVEDEADADSAVIRVLNTASGTTNSIALKATSNDATEGNGIGIVGEGAVGVKGIANNTITTGTNYGLYGQAANSSDTNIGVYGSGTDWAGYFDGDVYVASILQIDGGIHDGLDYGSTGDVLVADGSGGMTWQSASFDDDGDWTVVGDDMYSAPSGNVGIGTSDFTHKLTIEGADDNTLRLIGTGSVGEGATINFGDGDFVRIDEDVDDGLRLTAGRIALMPDADGVGIGTLLPDYDLDVNGDVAITGGLYDATDDAGFAGQVPIADGSGGWNWGDAATGSVRFDTLNATSHDVVVVTEDLQVDGDLMADTLQAVNDSIMVHSDVHFADAITFGGERKTSWPVGASNLDEAYDGGATIDVDAGEVKLDGDYITPGSGRILNILGNDDSDEILQVANGGSAPAIYSAGDLRVQNGKYILSRGDLKFQLNNGGSGSSTREFGIYDDGLSEIFSVNEDGDVFITGGIDDGSGSFGSNGQALLADGSGGMTWGNITSGIRFDTLAATAHDTVVVSQDFKIMGELIADSIQAAGDSIHLDDDIYVYGGMEFMDAPAAAGMHNFRTDWEPENVITVGGDNADFYDLDSALTYANSADNKVLHIAPGTYSLASSHNVNSDVSLIGSGSNNTAIDGASLTFVTLSMAEKISFSNDITSSGTHNNCSFVSGTHIFDGAKLNDCIITTNATIQSHTSRVNGSSFIGTIAIDGGPMMDDCYFEGSILSLATSPALPRFTSCRFNAAVITFDGSDLRPLIDASEFNNSRIVLQNGSQLDVKGTHFHNLTALAAITVNTGSSATILSNDFINTCTSVNATDPVKLRVIGNSVEGMSAATAGFMIAGGTSTTDIIIKDNQIEYLTQDGIDLSSLTGLSGNVTVDDNLVEGCTIGLDLNGTSDAIITHNNLYSNTTDINGISVACVVSHNVVDNYSPPGPHAGGFNTDSVGSIWGTNGQLP